MPRISNADIKVREQFILQTFTKNPALSAKEANELLKAEFGSMMRPVRVFELKRAVKKGINPTNGTASPKASRKGSSVTKAHRQAQTTPEVQEAVNHVLGGQYVVLKGSQEDIAVVLRMVEVLQSSGTDVTVDAALGKSLLTFTKALSA